METSEIQAALSAAVEEVLETMCFTSVMASDEGPLPPEAEAVAPALTADLRFSGDPSGEFRVGVPLSLARTMGAGFLGQDETDVSDSQAADVVCEVANMICGAVLSRLESNTIFRLTHPELTPPEQGVELEGASSTRWFDIGDGIVTVSLQLEPTA